MEERLAKPSRHLNCEARDPLELTAATGSQEHSVRGFLAGTLKKKLGYAVPSEPGVDGVRRYRIPA